MTEIDAAQLALLGKAVSPMLEDDGERTAEDREHLARSRERHRDRDTSGDVLMTRDDEDRRDDGRERRVRRHGRADVHPAESDHFKRTTDDDAGRHITEHKARHRARDERTVRLQLIEHGAHARDGRDDENEDDLDTTEFHYVSLHFEIF